MSILECFQHGKHLIAIVLSAAGEIEIQSHPPLSPPNSGKCTSIAVMRASWSVLCTRKIYKGASHDRPNQEPFLNGANHNAK